MPNEMPNVPSFQGLVIHLAEVHHRVKKDGNERVVYFHMAKALGVSPALVYQWKDGTVKRPSDRHLFKLAEVYNLDAMAILAVTYRP